MEVINNFHCVPKFCVTKSLAEKDVIADYGCYALLAYPLVIGFAGIEKSGGAQGRIPSGEGLIYSLVGSAVGREVNTVVQHWGILVEAVCHLVNDVAQGIGEDGAY